MNWRLLLGGIALATAAAAAQQPARDQGRRGEDARTGTGVISGQVVTADTGAPLSRVTVMLEDRGASYRRSTVTDDRGRFELAELPKGRYMLSAHRVAFLPAFHGQRSHDRPGVPIQLDAGQRVQNLRLPLMRGGILTGRVVDATGDPVAAVNVTLFKWGRRDGRPHLELASGWHNDAASSTNDLGEFRLYGLTPGRYLVAAMPDGAGGTTAFWRTDGQERGVATTYFPDTPTPTRAQVVTVRAGQETGGVVITLQTARLSRVRGRAVSIAGEPMAGAPLAVIQAAPTGDSMGWSGTTVAPDGTFEVNNLAPGDYLFVVGHYGSMDDAKSSMGLANVTVTGEDLEHLLIVASEGATVRGRIVADDGSSFPFEPTAIRLYARPTDRDRQRLSLRSAAVRDDWTFELTGLNRRGRLLFVQSLPDGSDRWHLKGIFQEGRDVTDEGIDFPPGRVIENVDVVLSRATTVLSGAVTNARGEPADDTTVIAYAGDEGDWTPESRLFRTIRPDGAGQYELPGLRPDIDYAVVALPGAVDDYWDLEDVLRTLRHRATRIRMSEGERRQVPLQVSEVP